MVAGLMQQTALPLQKTLREDDQLPSSLRFVV